MFVVANDKLQVGGQGSLGFYLSFCIKHTTATDLKICSTFSYLFDGLRKLSIPVFPTIVYSTLDILGLPCGLYLSYDDFGLITSYAGSSFRS